MKLMHSLPQQISITHTNGPHLSPRCKEKKKGGGEQHARGEKKKKPASTRNRIKKDRKRDSCAR